MSYPTTEQVEDASHEQLARWYRFLESPPGDAEAEVMNLILERFNKLGGWNPALSKQVGWEGIL